MYKYMYTFIHLYTWGLNLIWKRTLKFVSICKLWGQRCKHRVYDVFNESFILTRRFSSFTSNFTLKWNLPNCKLNKFYKFISQFTLVVPYTSCSVYLIILNKILFMFLCVYIRISYIYTPLNENEKWTKRTLKWY